MSKKVKSPLIRIMQLNKAIYMILFFFGITCDIYENHKDSKI